jgi:hypothetical protein
MRFTSTMVASTAAAPPQDSDFDFSNPNIAHFHAHLHFINSTSATLSAISLSDTGCDNREVKAAVYDQAGNKKTYTNGNGCGTTSTYGPFTFSQTGGLAYVHIKLWAENGNGSSSPVWSKKHYNPF